MNFKYDYDFQKDSDYFQRVKTIVESVERLFEIDYKNLELAIYPEIISEMFQIVKNLPAEKRVEEIKNEKEEESKKKEEKILESVEEEIEELEKEAEQKIPDAVDLVVKEITSEEK